MRLAALFITLLLLPAFLNAQDAGYRVLNYGGEQGLSQGTIRAITQDDKGFLWLATADGLNRFDGYSFKTYYVDSNHHQVRSFLRQGNILWLSISRGLHSIYRFDLYTETARKVFSYQPAPGEAETVVLGVEGDVITFAGTGLGIVKLNWQTGKTISALDAVKDIYPRLGGACIDAAQRAWYFNYQEQLFCYDIRNARHLPLPDNITDKRISQFILGSDGCLWITAFSALICYHPDIAKAEIYPVSATGARDTSFKITDIPYELDAYRLLVCTDRGGVLLFDRKQKKFIRDHPFTNVPKEILHLFFKDRSNNVFTSCDPYGLYKVDLKQKPFHTIAKDPASDTGLGSNFIKSLCQIGNELFIGTFNKGISVLNMSTGRYRHIDNFVSNKNDNAYIYSICAAPDSSLWVASSEGISVMDRKTGQFSQLSLNSGVFHNVYSILFLTGDTLCVGQDGSLLILHKKGMKCTQVAQLPVIQTGRMFRDNKGRIWVNCRQKLCILTNTNGTWSLQTILQNTGAMKCVYEDRKGIIWAGGELGLRKIDGNDLHLIKTYTDKDGMINSFVYGILEDDQHCLWLSTNKGLIRFDPATEHFRNYTAADGVQAGEFSSGAYYRNEQGELFFAGANGFNHFYPAQIQDNPHKPAAVITSFKMFDTTYHLDSAIEYKKAIYLNYDQNILSFEYAGLEFSNPEKNTYAYQMAGIDDKWIMAGTRRFARYANMAPGKYIFRVKAANEDGLWGDTTELFIYIKPPFWQTWWFRILAVVAIGTSFYFIIRFVSTRKLRRHLRELEMNQKLQQERQRISRDLHDNVGSQLSYIISNVNAEATKDEAEAGKLDAVKEVARSTMENLRETIWALNNEHVTCEDLADRLRKFLSVLLAFRDRPVLEWTVLPCERLFTPVQALNLYRIAQEAINNSLKHANSDKLSVTIQTIGNTFSIVVSDNGAGFDTEGPLPEDHYGLTNMRYRANEINATFAIDSAPGRGTTVTISLT